MITIRPDTPSFEQIIAMRERNQLLDDWRKVDDLARAAHELTIYFAILRGEELIGWAWYEEYLEQAPDLGCTLGFCVEQEWRGKWLTTAMPDVVKLLGYAFGTLGVRRISAKFDRRRGYVEKFYKKLGFAFEGRMNNGLVVEGRSRDLTLLGLTVEAFEEVRDALGVGDPGSS